MTRPIPPELNASLRMPYAMRRVPPSSIHTLLPVPTDPRPGDVALARLEKVGKNASLELSSGRRAGLATGDALGVVFGNRYATLQFEGYARSNGDRCDLLSMGGVCGLVESRHDSVSEPSRLVLLGALGDADGRPLRLADFAVPALSMPEGPGRPRITVVVGTSMDAGKTYTARSIITGLRHAGERVGAIKLTGTASGRDMWSMLDAGARVALDFIDGGWPSTYQCSLAELLTLYGRLMAHAAAAGATSVVVEIADGIVQGETAALLASPAFSSTVDAWVVAAVDALGAAGTTSLLRSHGIVPIAISGVVSRSPLARREASVASGVPCRSATELAAGALNVQLLGVSGSPAPGGETGSRDGHNASTVQTPRDAGTETMAEAPAGGAVRAAAS